MWRFVGVLCTYTSAVMRSLCGSYAAMRSYTACGSYAASCGTCGSCGSCGTCCSCGPCGSYGPCGFELISFLSLWDLN
ncbi:hypothetical protein M6B38_182650 [Iris pallida]|uniref:Secreted protein n=1 Tax=Iris pallida TaxID=29817 RepID=A0AAX6EKT1_IRIPA|nr:hypothetical protein M6B38_182650 [Iris pallida]